MFPNHLNFYFNYKISGDTSGGLDEAGRFAGQVLLLYFAYHYQVLKAKLLKTALLIFG